MNKVPEKAQVLVIGGGPGGSTAATLLAKEGFQVTLLERDTFPRYHIGESLLPSLLEILDLLGARSLIENHGFQRKPGAYFEWGDEQWPLDFGELTDNCTYSFQVDRADFDHLLLKHSRTQGVNAVEGVEVRGVSFDGDRPRSATWAEKGGEGRSGKIEFDYLVDASGRTGVMANRHLRSRRYHEAFQNVALWRYFKGAERNSSGRTGDIILISNPNGWFWGIPLKDDVMSIGLVTHKKTVSEKRRTMSSEEILAEAIDTTPFIKKMVESAEIVSDVYVEADYSYTSEKFAGPGYFLVGDAACFLDPLLSSGVHLATFSALLAAASIASTERGEVKESHAIGFYEKSYMNAYLRFLVFVSSFYQQHRGRQSHFWEAQQLTRTDVDSTSLHQAFLHLISGIEDMSDIKDDVHHVVRENMRRRVAENLKIRQDKDALPAQLEDKKELVSANAEFFGKVEGLFSLSPSESVDGLYVRTEPHLRLAHAHVTEEALREVHEELVR